MTEDDGEEADVGTTTDEEMGLCEFFDTEDPSRYGAKDGVSIHHQSIM